LKLPPLFPHLIVFLVATLSGNHVQFQMTSAALWTRVPFPPFREKQHTVGQLGSRVTSNDIQRHPTTSNDIQRHPSIHPSIHPSHQYSTIHPGHIGMAAYGQLVTGPPGAGKTTYCHGMHQVSLFCWSLQFTDPDLL
jgi:hypothetical protein